MSLGELKICKQHGEVKPNIHGNCSFCGNKVEVTKRVPLSMIRLYKLVAEFDHIQKPPNSNSYIIEFLTFVNKHKNDTL